MNSDPLFPSELVDDSGNLSDYYAVQMFQGAVELSGNPVATYLARIAPTTRKASVHCLRLAARFFEGGECNPAYFQWWKLEYRNMVCIRSWLRPRYSWQSGNRVLSTVKAVLKESWRLGLMTNGAYQRAVSLDRLKGPRILRGRYVRPHELAPVFAACAADPRSHGIRDAAIIALLYCTGLRRMEAANLNLKDYDPDMGRITVQIDKMLGRREAFVTNECKSALDAWIELRGKEPGPLFYTIQRKGHIQTTRLAGYSIYNVVRPRAKQAGLGPVTTHDMRRSFITSMLERGTDIITTRNLAGHVNLSTTAMYDYRGQHAMREACEGFHVPYLSEPVRDYIGELEQPRFRYQHMQNLILGKYDWRVMDGLTANRVMTITVPRRQNVIAAQHPPGLLNWPSQRELMADRVLKNRIKNLYQTLWCSVRKLERYGRYLHKVWKKRQAVSNLPGEQPRAEMPLTEGDHRHEEAEHRGGYWVKGCF